MTKYFKDITENELNAVKSIISLFKAVPYQRNCFKFDKNSQEQNIKKGFVFSDKAIEHAAVYVHNIDIIQHTFREYGYDVKNELNNGFYKNFNKPIESSQYELFCHQIMHYISTYGFMNDGIYRDGIMYIPNEKINLDENIPAIKLTVIDVIDEEEIKNKVMSMLYSGIALSSKVLNHLLNIVKYYEFEIDPEEIKNKEMKIILCKEFDIVPKSPVEFLRLIIYLTTNESLLIKNKKMIESIKQELSIDPKQSEKILYKFNMYFKNVENGWKNLSSIFLRYKPLFLAFKSKNKELNKIINRLRKLSVKYHHPIETKILDLLTSDPNLSALEIENELNKITPFKKISILNTLLFRLNNPEYIMYSIRNGKSYVSNLKYKDNNYISNYKRYISYILNSLISKMKVKGKKIHLPEDLIYVAPMSEKKFFGNIPFGSYYNFKSKNIVIGVHWFNIQYNTYEVNVDLDLAYQSLNRNIGWNNWYQYHDDDNNYIDLKEAAFSFSGDMTSAPIDKGGAVECYYFSKQIKDEMATINLHFYNRANVKLKLENSKISSAVPFELIIDEEINKRAIRGRKIARNNLISPTSIKFSIPWQIDQNKLNIGFLDSDEEGNKKFYFYSTQVGNSRINTNKPYVNEMLKYINSYLSSCVTLKELLEKAGAIFTKDENEEWDIDLDYHKVTKDQIINLFE